MKKTLLWTNPNPTSSIGQTTITPTTALSNFTHLLIYYKNENTGTSTRTTIAKISEIGTAYHRAYGFGCMSTESNQSWGYIRGIYKSGTNLILTRCLRTSDTMRDDFIIPTQIYGINGLDLED